MAEEPVITLRGVTFAYGREPVLEDVNLTIRERESGCIIGPNGGGKTTLLKLVLGLLKPDRGEVRVFGRRPEHVRLRMGYVPQHMHYDPQFPVTVKEIVLMGRLGRRLGGRYSREDRRAADGAMEDVGIRDLAERLFPDLSGGQRQRALIARALVTEPDLLMLDEPTSNVDRLVEAKLVRLLRERHERLTTVMVSHDLAFVSDLFEKTICVNRQVFVHPTTEVTGEVIQEVYNAPVRLVQHGREWVAEEEEHE